MTWCNAPGVRPALLASRRRRSDSHHRARIRRFALGLAVLSLGACDFPTEPPIFDSRFVIPAEQTTLHISELLPNEVAVSGADFTLALQPATFSQTLGQMCPPCALAHGLTVPKPPFADTFPVTLTLPADVQSAVLAGGSVNIAVSHNFGFDPLRPQGGADGSLSMTIRSGGSVIGTLVVNDPFPSGSTLTRNVPLTANANISAPLSVDIGLVSPQGTDLVTINANASLSVVAAPSGIRISQANVRVPSTPVDVEQVSIDLSDIDSEMAERVQSGAIVARITNPFNAGGNLTLTIGGATVAPKTVAVAPCAAATPCTTTQRVEFSQAEIQSMLGRTVTLSIRGVLSSSSGFITVKPTQQIDIDTQLDLVLRLGGDVD